jgi:hypothetical protein
MSWSKSMVVTWPKPRRGNQRPKTTEPFYQMPPSQYETLGAAELTRGRQVSVGGMLLEVNGFMVWSDKQGWMDCSHLPHWAERIRVVWRYRDGRSLASTREFRPNDTFEVLKERVELLAT